MQKSLKQVWLLLEPSWLSGLAAGVASAVVVAGTVAISNYNGSSLQQELFNVKHARGFSFGFDAVTNNLASNTVVSNAPLFLFWAAMGVIVYLAATGLWGALSNAEELREEMEYVNAPKQSLLRTVLSHLIFRLLFLGLWLAYLQLFLKVLLPYTLAAAHVAAASFSLSNVGFGLLALLVILVSLHIHIIFARLIMLRERVFGNDIA